MKKGVLYISRPSLTSPRLQDAVDNAPDLTGVGLNAPLFSGLSTNAPTISSSFGTSPSLLKAVLSYILNYNFDISELVGLLDTLDSIRIPKMKKEDVVDAFEEFKISRAVELPDDIGFWDDEDIKFKKSSGIPTEFASTEDRLLVYKTAAKDPLLDLFTASDSASFETGADLIEGISAFLEVDLLKTSAMEDSSFAFINSPYIFSGAVDTLELQKVKTQSSTTNQINPFKESFVGILNTFNDATGDGMLVTPAILPKFTEQIASLASIALASKTPKDSILDIFNPNQEVRKKFSTDIKKFSTESGLAEEFKVGTTDLLTNFPKFIRQENLFTTEIPYVISGEQKSLDLQKAATNSEVPVFLTNKKPLDIVEVLEEARKFRKPGIVENIDINQFVNTSKPRSLDTQNVKAINKVERRKIVLEFIIDETFFSIFSQLPGPIAGKPLGSGPTTYFVDLGDKFDRPIVGTSLDEDGNLINGTGWPANAQAQIQNERYIIVDHIYANFGRFRSGTDSAVLPDLREKYSHQAVKRTGYGEGEIDRFTDSAMVSTDSAKIYSEGGLAVGRRMVNGFGYRGYYGPAPLRYKYGVRPGNFSQNPQPEWHTEQGLYYSDQYIETVTHQDSGRRINLFFREMTADDIAISNTHGGTLQLTSGQTFIDKMLADSYWSKYFKHVDTLVKLGPGSRQEENINSAETLKFAGSNRIIQDKVSATFLHRYESEALSLEDPIYDVILQYSPGADRDGAFVDAFRNWPAYAGTQPLDFEQKMLIKYSKQFDIDKMHTSSLAPLVLGGNIESVLEKLTSTAVREPHHIVKKPVYFRDANGDSLLPIDYDLISSTAPQEPAIGFIWYDTGTGKVYIRRASDLGFEFWEHVGPFEEAVSLLEERDILYFKQYDQDVAATKSLKPSVFSGSTLAKLERIFAIEDIGIVQKPSPEEVLNLLEEGYLKNIQVGTTTLGAPVFEQVFIKQPRIKTNKEFLNEVAVADSGTAFVPIYCLPSYFTEAYVGEDGTHANF
jgi:hypothetical protein